MPMVNLLHTIKGRFAPKRVTVTNLFQRPARHFLRWLFILAMVCASFTRESPLLRISHADEETITIYKLTTLTTEKDCHFDDALSIRINDKSINSHVFDNEYDVKVAPGTQRISVSIPGRPKAKISKVEVGSSDENKQSFIADAGGVATVLINKDNELRGSINVIVYLTGLCEEDTNEKQKNLWLFLRAAGCKKGPSWSDVQVLDAGKLWFETNNPNFNIQSDGKTIEGNDDDFKPGAHSLRIYSRSFPKTTLMGVTVYKFLCDDSVATCDQRKTVNKSDAGETGEVTIPLDENLWTKDKFGDPAILVKVWGNCQTPTIDPQEFGVVKVKAVSGNVEVKKIVVQYNGSEKILFKPEIDTELRQGSSLGDQTIITTGPDGLVVLESEYKHTITIDSSTQVRLDDLMTAAGRKQLGAFIKKGKITIERESSESNSESGVAVQTDTATVTSAHTIYSVSYDATARKTTVDVKDGQVDVIPENAALERVTVSANHQLQVSDTRVVRDNASFGLAGSDTTTILMYVGIGVGSLLGLIILLVIVYVLYRFLTPKSPRPAYQAQPAVVDHGPRAVGQPNVQPQLRHCPRCGTSLASTKKFCTACGLRLI